LQPTILLTNDRKTGAAKVITRYAQRMLIENALLDAVRFFHMNALTSNVGIKVDFDVALLVIASGFYRLLARKPYSRPKLRVSMCGAAVWSRVSAVR
jgi:hypothetical protein